MQKVSRLAVAAVTFLTLAGVSQAESYSIDLAHSKVGFKIRHIVSKTSGAFENFAGTVDFNPGKASPLASSVVIKTESVNTATAKRDEHLRSPDFFNVAKYPDMTFKSTSSKLVSPGNWELVGDLTLLGVTKPVTLAVTGGDTADDPWGNKRIGFSATGKLNRKDYGMVFNMAMDKGGVMLGDEVEIQIEIEGVQPKPGADKKGGKKK